MNFIQIINDNLPKLANIDLLTLDELIIIYDKMDRNDYSDCFNYVEPINHDNDDHDENDNINERNIYNYLDFHDLLKKIIEFKLANPGYILEKLTLVEQLLSYPPINIYEYQYINQLTNEVHLKKE